MDVRVDRAGLAGTGGFRNNALISSVIFTSAIPSVTAALCAAFFAASSACSIVNSMSWVIASTIPPLADLVSAPRFFDRFGILQ